MKDAISIIDWILSIFSRCMETGVVLEDWKVECIIQLCKGRGGGFRLGRD